MWLKHTEKRRIYGLRLSFGSPTQNEEITGETGLSEAKPNKVEARECMDGQRLKGQLTVMGPLQGHANKGS